MKDEEFNKNQDFSKSPLSLPNQIKSDEQQDKSDQSNQNQNFDKNFSDVPQLDFNKAIIPEELIQQMQEQQIQQIAEEQANKKYTKKKQNDDLPDFLNQKICLDENGDNYYEVAAKKAKEQNSTLFQLKTYVATQATTAQNSVKKQLKKLDTHIKNKILEKKSHINLWIAGQVDAQVVSLMSSIEPKITDSVQKSVPYDFMQGFAQDTATNLWKDFTDLIRLELRAKLEKKQVEIRKKDTKGVIQHVRNFILYSLYPADLSNRDHMRRISYQFMKFCQLLPYMGIQPLMFSIILLCINKDEEFQLVNYIADYKSLQFITNGLFPCFLAYFHYLFFDCGPGNHHQVYILMFTLSIQVLTVWIAYLLLNRSYSRGAILKEQLTITQDTKGGRLKYFLIYDLVCLIISLIMSAFLYFYKIKDSPTQSFGDLLFFTRTVYALLSIPFVCFIFPFFVKMLTNAIPTGYDKYGNCIPSLSTIQLSYKETKLRRQTMIDIEEILERDLLDKNEGEDKKQEDQNNEENVNGKRIKQKKEMQKTIG
ncbi:unnamed protein product (macronuclear) [Paramecium tetraurelia]|uniref:Transmembrane protein n=1 Tax=Paramecium tetraurelia TaxID=5888 RepID=A0E3R8_PARTE|nr:uncharacterized protein GSPATT00023108001 [Paramecium tetraurelia]CAK89935.1 unnamed protein product [Paramecium tetraurelia]|eukprot:XP_001457332.1 hypothetical protein (macronuclear) [Paramecium tetraurelia strain d4-2]